MFLHIYFEIQVTINKIRQKLNVIKLFNNKNFTPKIYPFPKSDGTTRPFSGYRS